MNQIFISYRREDSAGYSGRLADRLAMAFGEEQIFRDFDDIGPGQNFAASIRKNLSSAQVFLVVIGSNWLAARNDRHQRRLDDAEDFVRLEIETALQRGIQIIPLLINGARMPNRSDLPASLSALSYRQAVELSDSRWDQDVDQLIEHIKDYIKPAAARGRRSAAYIGIGLFALVAVAIGITRLPANFSGHWYFASGDYLAISQQGDRVTLQHIDPSTQTGYEQGEGHVDGRRLSFTLDPIYSSRFKYRGTLQKSWDGQTLTGELIEVFSDEHSGLSLTKQPGAKNGS